MFAKYMCPPHLKTYMWRKWTEKCKKISRGKTAFKPKIQLDLDNLIINLISVGENENNSHFLKSKEHKYVKNCSIVPKINFDLNIYMLNLYTKLHFNGSNLSKENKKKPQQCLGVSELKYVLKTIILNQWKKYFDLK